MRRYRLVLVASEHMAREYRRHGIDAHTIVHTHKGSNEGAPPSPVKLPLSGILRLAFLGRMEKLKGISHLLKALPRVVKELNKKIVFNIGGQGNDERRLRAIALRVTRDNPAITVNFRGWLDPLQCQQLLSESHLMVMPSVWPEPFGGVGSLAGELNVPAVAFDVGGISEWLHDGINGVLAPGDPPTPEGLADAIIRAVRDPDLYQQLCEGAHRYSRGASMVEHVASIEDWLARAQRGDQSIPNIC
jgi:glycosyltransferase involved in cell wall biosynthesis